MSLEKERQQSQLAFQASGQQIEVGEKSALPLPVEQLAHTTPQSEYVVKAIESGLTAYVYRIQAGGRHWTLKRKRAESLVKNVDGQTSFLNEVQRRRDITALQRQPETAPLFTHIVETQYASFLDGVILSPWIEGERLQRFDGRVYDQLFGTIVNLELHGLFEWDFCPGNVLDDGQKIFLFDFGYMYRFDPRQHYNNNGFATPLFHGVERFETRNFFDHLLRNPHGLDAQGLFGVYREEKTYALKHYENKLQRLEAMKAVEPVLQWQAAINQRWRQALRSNDSLHKLYLIESFRSNVLDLFDDLHGKSCTPITLKKAEFAVSTLREHFTLLREENGLFFGDETKTQDELILKYQELRAKAVEYQLPTS
ncbi:hypothetical protein SAMN05444354_11897 [Stigmatella aurantiaca]|uniref:Phosphotransferase enzyme family protein n=1 Tax=Stigmatella aurantiaca TaxID=41 RepID=A0A1H7Z7Q8_STIAU|nr:hypothetical protein [Stigmatella aurantiaca]SEM54261.1 hypothetical protein SAMN05444354_11897 [Stigmatella aurantiaca]